MSKINNSSIAQRYFWIAFALVIVFIMIIGKAFYTMTAKKQYWIEVASRLKSDSITVKPTEEISSVATDNSWQVLFPNTKSIWTSV